MILFTLGVVRNHGMGEEVLRGLSPMLGVLRVIHLRQTCLHAQTKGLSLMQTERLGSQSLAGLASEELMTRIVYMGGRADEIQVRNSCSAFGLCVLWRHYNEQSAFAVEERVGQGLNCGF